MGHYTHIVQLAHLAILLNVKDLVIDLLLVLLSHGKISFEALALSYNFLLELLIEHLFESLVFSCDLLSCQLL